MVSFTLRRSKDKSLSHLIYKLQRHGFMCIYLPFSKDVSLCMDVERALGATLPTCPLQRRFFYWKSIQHCTILWMLAFSLLIVVLTHFIILVFMTIRPFPCFCLPQTSKTFVGIDLAVGLKVNLKTELGLWKLWRVMDLANNFCAFLQTRLNHYISWTWIKPQVGYSFIQWSFSCNNKTRSFHLPFIFSPTLIKYCILNVIKVLWTWSCSIFYTPWLLWSPCLRDLEDC